MINQIQQPTEEQEKANIKRAYPEKYKLFGDITRTDIMTRMKKNCAWQAHRANVLFEVVRQTTNTLKKAGLAGIIVGGVVAFERYSFGEGFFNAEIYNALASPVLVGLGYAVKRLLVGSIKPRALFVDEIIPGESHLETRIYGYDVGAAGHLNLLRNWFKIGKMQDEGKIRVAEWEKMDARYDEIYCVDEGGGL